MFYSFLKKFAIFIIIIPIALNSCKGPDGKFKLPGGDARKNPYDERERVKKNLAEGKGFRLNKTIQNLGKGGTFDFASSNELWKASLDVIEFMPLSSVNYSGGIIITDWYSSDGNTNESIKISIRFLSNEVRSDALDINVFIKKCDKNNKCITSNNDGDLLASLKTNILKKAAINEKTYKEKNKKDYKGARNRE